MSAKPFHRGHLKAVQFAADLVDVLYLYVSTSDRKRKGEISVFGRDVKKLWPQIEPLLPTNAVVGFAENPLSAIYDQAKSTQETEQCLVFAGEEDMERCYGNRLSAAAPHLQITLVPIPRYDGVSGTKVRKAIMWGDKKLFGELMPAGIDLELAWKLFAKS